MSEKIETNYNEFVKLVSMGPLDFNLTLILNDDVCKQFNISNQESNFNSIKDFQIFFERQITHSVTITKENEQSLLDLIRLNSDNPAIESLIFINKVYKKKVFIEYLTLSEFEFEDDESFIKEVIKYVSEQNYIFIISNNTEKVNILCELKISFIIKYEAGHDKGWRKIIHLKGKNKKNEINPDLRTNNINLYEALDYDFKHCNYFYLDLNNILRENEKNSEKENLSQVSETTTQATYINCNHIYEFLQNLTTRFPMINVTINFPDILSSNLNLKSSTAFENLTKISEIFYYTDTFIFEKKEGVALFNILNINETGLEEILEMIFLKDIKKKGKIHPKIGLFFDEFNKVTVVEQQVKSNLILFHKDFSFDIIPSVVSDTIAEDYKKLLVVHSLKLKSIFIGGFMSRLLDKKSFKTCFTAGSESLKRVIEIYRFEIDFPIDTNYYMIKIPKIKKEKSNTEPEMKRKKEQHFVLDSINLMNSKMKNYNPLYDNNLQTYFSSMNIRKHLKKLGFIDRKGQILQDPDIKNHKRPPVINSNLIKLYEQEQKKLLQIKDNNDKMKLQINNLLQVARKNLNDINWNELDKLARVYNFNPIYGKKLPAIIKPEFSINCRNDLYTKAIAENKKDYILSNYSQNKNNKNNLKPINKESYIRLINSIEIEKKNQISGANSNSSAKNHEIEIDKNNPNI